MKRIIVILAVAMVMAIGISSFALAKGPGFVRGPMVSQENVIQGKGYGLTLGRGYFSNLNLTSDQQNKLLEVEKKYLETMQTLRNQIQSARLSLRELALQEASEENAAQIRAKIAEIMDLQQKIQETRKNMYQEFLNLFTPQQLSDLAKYGRYRGYFPEIGMRTPWRKW